jgi:hypothetical protein
MRKRVVVDNSQHDSPADGGWLDLPAVAAVEVTSEDAAHPVESALAADPGGGWRAAQPGEQVIRVLFDEPRRLRRIHLLFEEEGRARTQEFVLRWSGDGGRTYREVVRQQYNFSPPGTAREAEDYRVELDGVTALELRIVPDVGGGDARASLGRLRLA